MDIELLTYLWNPYVLSGILLPLIYLYTTRNHNFWKKLGVPGPTPVPILGNFIDNILMSGVDVERTRYEKYGKIYGVYEGNTPVLYVADPELIKLITVKDWTSFVNRNKLPAYNKIFLKNMLSLNDDKWRSVRSIVSPTFTSGKIKQMMKLMNECVQGVINNLNSAADHKKDVDVKKLFGAYTMDVIATCAFGTKTDAHTNPNDPLLKNAHLFFERKLTTVLTFLLVPDFLKELLQIDIFPSDAINFFAELSMHVLTERRKGGVKRNDFVQLLLEAEADKEAVNLNGFEDHNKKPNIDHNDNFDRNNNSETTSPSGHPKSQSVKQKLTDEEAVGQMIVFFIAGYETTNTLLSYCAYCLALNPDIQDKLYEELFSDIKDHENITYEELGKLEYLNAVVSETLRLYQPLMKMDRVAGEDYTLGNTGIKIPKGTPVQLGFYGLHHDKENFPEPYQFKPERFLKENLDQIKPYTYLPFGAGPRYCIGMRFALVEAKLILCKVLLKFKFVRSSNTEVPLKYTTQPILMHANSIIVKVEKR